MLGTKKRVLSIIAKGVSGDYDAFDDVEQLIRFIKTGKR